MLQPFHVVAHTLHDAAPLADPTVRDWLWQRLRKAFPAVGAACIMPDHVHLIVWALVARELARRLASVLGGLTRRLDQQRLWFPVPEPTRIADRDHLRRTGRYLHMNPVRAGLVADPLEWPHSTHRGVVGAELDPWLPAVTLRTMLGSREPRASFVEWFHGYVSADAPTPNGTRLPTPAPAQTIPHATLADVLSAAIASTTWTRERAVRRRVAALLAADQGWRDARHVSEALGLTPRAVRTITARPDERLIAPAKLCLGDQRLRAHLRLAKSMDTVLAALRPTKAPR